jgi:glycine/D-amino acid oxidase-like deaminating enzyme
MPPSSADTTIIVGAGLAGACAAFHLSRHGPVHVLEAEAPAAGASGAAAGLANPLMGRKANPVWRPHEALEAVHDLVDRLSRPDLFRTGVLRPAVEEAQVEFFRAAVEEHPDLATWLPEAEVRERFPDVRTAGGALFEPRAGAADVPALVEALLGAARERGAVVETGATARAWDEDAHGATVEVDAGGERRTLRGARLLLCLGQGYPGHAPLEALGLTGIKGHTVRVERPEGLQGPLPPLSGRGYIVPETGGTLVLGSSYDHDFETLAPDPEQVAYIQNKTAEMLPGVDDAPVVDVATGVRVKTDATNLPVVGPMPGRERTWVFTALGSKGLLTAPLLARSLADYWRDPTSIPDAVRVPEPEPAGGHREERTEE